MKYVSREMFYEAKGGSVLHTCISFIIDVLRTWKETINVEGQ